VTETSGQTVSGRALAGGRASGTALVLTAPLSLWGGLDSATGRIIDQRHPQRGAVVTGRILVMPGGRGSSSSSSVLAEAIRAGTAPAAILLAEPDLIIALGAHVAAELYGRSVPIVVISAACYATIADGDALSITADEDTATIAIRHTA
jgi:predicted aconitase with swiveling domain